MLFYLILLWKLLFFYDSLRVENWKFKLQHLFEIEIFYNIINAFTVTFDQFN